MEDNQGITDENSVKKYTIFRQDISGIVCGSGQTVVVNFGKESYEEHVLSLIREYDRKAHLNKIIHNIIQMTIFVSSGIAATLVAFSTIPKIVPAILSGIAAILTAITNYYKFDKNWHDFEKTSEYMALEYNRFNSGRGTYARKKKKESLDLFMDQIENLLVDPKQRK